MSPRRTPRRTPDSHGLVSHGIAVLLLAWVTPSVALARGLPDGVVYGALFLMYALLVTVIAAFFMKGSSRAGTLGLVGGVILGVVFCLVIVGVSHTASGPLKVSYTLGMAVVGVGVACAVAINRWLCKRDPAPD